MGAPGSTTRGVGSYYLHQFAVEQPDLDWWNADVRAEFDRILRYWFDRGVTGFRVDVAHALIKDRELRDGVRYQRERPEVHEIYAALAGDRRASTTRSRCSWARRTSSCRSCGRTRSTSISSRTSPSSRRSSAVDELRPIVELVEAKLPAGRDPVWFGSNHDHSRLATRWAERRRAQGARRALPAADASRQRGALPGRRARAASTAPFRPTASPTWPTRRAIRSGRRCRGRRRVASGASRGCRSPTRGGTSRISVPTREAHSTTCARSSRRRRAFADAPYSTLPSAGGVWAYARGDATCVVNLTR